MVSFVESHTHNDLETNYTFDFFRDRILSYIQIGDFLSRKCNVSINIMDRFHMICHSFIFYGLNIGGTILESKS